MIFQLNRHEGIQTQNTKAVVMDALYADRRYEKKLLPCFSVMKKLPVDLIGDHKGVNST